MFLAKFQCLSLESQLPTTDQSGLFWPSRTTPALSQDQDLKNALLISLIVCCPIDHTDAGRGCKNLKTWGKKGFLALFVTQNSCFPTFKH